MGPPGDRKQQRVFSKLTFDEQHFEALGGKVQLQSPGYDGASDRYEIEVSGGASEITVR